MLARLGLVLYWIGVVCASIAIIIGVYAGWMMSHSHNSNDVAAVPIVLGVSALCAVAIWAVGRACKYILSGV